MEVVDSKVVTWWMVCFFSAMPSFHHIQPVKVTNVTKRSGLNINLYS